MATAFNINNTTAIDLGDAKVVVPEEYPILNPEMLPDAKCVWIGALRHGDDGLPRRVIWLEDRPFGEGHRPDEDIVMDVYLDKFGASDEQKVRFARWDELYETWRKGQTPELAEEIQNGDHNALGLWPIIPGSVAAEYYFTSLDGDGVA